LGIQISGSEEKIFIIKIRSWRTKLRKKLSLEKRKSTDKKKKKRQKKSENKKMLKKKTKWLFSKILF